MVLSGARSPSRVRGPILGISPSHDGGDRPSRAVPTDASGPVSFGAVGVLIDLDDGSRVTIRVATPDDAPALEAGFAHLSDDSRYARFFTAVPKLSGAVLRQLTELDGTTRLAIAAFDPDRPSEVGTDEGFGVAVGRLIAPEDDPTAAELAVAVIDEYHGRGLGRWLVAALVAAAEQVGFTELRGFVLTTNEPMIALFRDLGATVRTDHPPEAGVIEFGVAVADAGARLREHGPSPDLFAGFFSRNQTAAAPSDPTGPSTSSY